MIAFRRVAVVVAFACLPALLLVSPAPGAARKRLPPAPKPAPKPAQAKIVPSTRLPVEREAAGKLEAVADYIGNEDWEEATRLLQYLLDRKADTLVPVVRKDGAGREVRSYVSMRAAAGHLVAALPAKAREFYEVKYLPQADRLLKAAAKDGKPDALAVLADHYLYTSAGPEAVQRLARHYAAARDYPLAAARYAQLLRHRGIARWLPDELYEATVAFRRTGDKRHGDRTARELLERAGAAPLRLGKRTLTRDEIAKELAALAVATGRDTWPIYRGNVRRDAQGIGGTAFMGKKPLWMQPLIREPDSTGAWIKKATDRLKHVKQPVLTAFFPVTASGPVGKERKISPLLIYRSYWGVHAVDMKTGRLQWEAHSKWSLDRMLGRGSDGRKMRAMDEWLKYYIDSNQRPGIVFENSLATGLSSDNTFVYAIHDLAVAPPHMVNPYGGFTPAPAYGADIGEAINQNRLQAFHLATNGKLHWEIGGPDGKHGLDNTYFLGPPLPLGGKLYVLAETKQEIRLVRIDPTFRNPDGVFVPKVLSVQPLAKAIKKLAEEPLRRTRALHPAFGGGILVCPTNAGVVVGVDLLSNTIAWAYPYKSDTAPPAAPGPARRWPPPGFIVGPDGRLYPVTRNNQWRDSAPVIQGGKVVFTALDSASVHCLNLRDGSPAWSKKRQENDLYLAGVFKDKVLIVGKTNCRALRLADGATAWTLETGLPSGQGVASDNVYYLPLAHGPRDKQPEICAIDVDKGIIRSHTRSRFGQVPGNLLFYLGDVVSQTPTEIVSYPQLRVKLAQMDALLAKNPDDPQGLTERGELRLDKGDLAGAVADLTRALDNKPPEGVRAKARALLFQALTDFLQRDFSAAEKYLKLYEELCDTDAATATGAEKLKREAEEMRRRATFLVLLGRGRESQGKYVEALRAYLRMADLGPSEDMLTLISDPGVKIRRDLWVRARIADLLRKAPPAQRKRLEEEIEKRLKKLGDGKALGALRGFVALFGPETAAGRAARLLLARHLTERRTDLLEADRALQEVRGQRDASDTSKALLGLAKLQVRRGRLADAVYYYRLLAREYPDTVVEDGQTGKELYEELATDKRFLPYLDAEDKVSWTGKITATEESGVWRLEYQSYTFPQDGEHLPWFRRYQLAVRFDYHQLKLVDRMTGEGRWTKALTKTMFQNMLNGNGRPNGARFPMHTIGDLVILPVGHMVFGIDPVGKQILWEKDLLGSTAPAPGVGAMGYVSLTADPRDDKLRIVYPDGWVQYLGGPLVLTPSAFALVTHLGLEALDPLTGQTLWRRTDISPNSHIFGDDRRVFVVETAPDGKVKATHAFRLDDGSSVRVPDFTAAYEKRLHIAGGRLLVSETGSRDAGMLRLYDILSGKNLWKGTYPANSLVLHAEDTALAGVIEPTGKVHVLDTRSGAEKFTGRVRPAHLKGVNTGYLLADGHNVYVLCNRPADPAATPWGGVQSNLMPGVGLRSVPVNGWVYAFRRINGRLRWRVELPNQTLLRQPLAGLPLLVCTCRYQKWETKDEVRRVKQVVSVVALDKRTGKKVIDLNNPDMPQFHDVIVNFSGHRIALVSYNRKITFQLTPEAEPRPKK